MRTSSIALAGATLCLSKVRVQSWIPSSETGSSGQRVPLLSQLRLVHAGAATAPSTTSSTTLLTTSLLTTSLLTTSLMLSSGSGDLDYEYIPPNPEPSSSSTVDSATLPSAYPADTPSGLRGEAVRSALRSDRCVVWDLSDTQLSHGGILRVTGKGTLNFINNKFTQSFDSTSNQYKEACYLTSKGRVLDRLKIAVQSPLEAYIMTSPGHSSQKLFESLDPLIFPMDQVKLENMVSNTNVVSFTMASVKMKHVHKVIQQQVLHGFDVEIDFETTRAQSSASPVGSMEKSTIMVQLNDSTSLLLLPSTGLPAVACTGYTLVFLSDDVSVGRDIWQFLISDDNADGPIELGALEYDTLRIEAGQPAFDSEYIGSNKKEAKTGPLELHWKGEAIDFDKGCYLGQEGVASVLKNVRGPPRLLYSVAFYDNDNVYNTESRGDNSKVKNKTRRPQVGDVLCVLGSNDAISVGTITSLAEPGGTGDACIVGLALVKRADSILKQMKDMELEIDRSNPFGGFDSGDGFDDFDDEEGGIDAYERAMNAAMDKSSRGMVDESMLDPLDGLEVILKDSFTIGKLRMIPSRRYLQGRNMFDETIGSDESQGELYELNMPDEMARLMKQQELEEGMRQASSPASSPDNSGIDDNVVEALVDDNEVDNGVLDADAELQQAEEEAKKAQMEAEAAAAEAQRKAEKMEMLKKRAEEAMARRKQAKDDADTQQQHQNQQPQGEAADTGDDSSQDAKEAEAKRKEDKMKMLKKRAEEAMARRKSKTQDK